MIKRIITFVLCIALCVSCVAIGLINQKANDADIAAGAIGGAGNGTVDKISADGAATSLLTYNNTTGEYELGGNITINADNADTHATYQALVALIDNKANGNTAVTIDGKDNTITTDRPLFASIANVTIKNLTIDGNIETTVTTFGAIANSVTAPFSANNVTNNADVTYVGGAAEVNAGGLFGSVTNGAVLENCVNNGDVTVDAGLSGLRAGGILAMHSGALMTFRNCVNNGNIDVGTSSTFSWVGGIAGQAAVTWTVFDKVLNTGNITVENSGVNGNMVMVGGIAGHNQALKISDAINLGNISYTYVGTAAASIATLGGIIGRGHHTTDFIRCINAGDISMTDANGTGTPNQIGGISPNWYNRGNISNFRDCISIGTCTSNSTEKAPITPFYHVSVSNMYNCYVKAFDGIKPGMLTNNDSGTYNNLFVITLPENIDTLLNNIKTNGITDGAAVFSAILAVSKYDANYAHNNDDGMFLNTVDVGFSVTADAERNNYFTTAIDKDYLDALKAIVGPDVEIGAIITPAAYVDTIGEFTHDAFDTYYEANKDVIDPKVAANGHDPITALYVTAKFGDGADFTDVDGVYNAGIYLSGAYDTAYAAKMYVKVADGAYVYSK